MAKLVKQIDLAMTAIHHDILQQASSTSSTAASVGAEAIKDPEQAKKELYAFYLDGSKTEHINSSTTTIETTTISSSKK